MSADEIEGLIKARIREIAFDADVTRAKVAALLYREPCAHVEERVGAAVIWR